MTSSPRANALIAILGDRSARLDERDDAAIDLGNFDDHQVIDFLMAVASDPLEDDLLVASCGESLAQIFVRTGHFELNWLKGLRPMAVDEIVPWIRRERPELLRMYDE